MENGTVSVIIPIYNCGEYVEKCVQSFLSQTYEDLEIILVDDGSSDSSSAKCDALAEISDKIKVFHNENHGVSFSRNFGLSKCCGDYIMFCDADDYIDEDTIEYLMKKLKENEADISVCSMVREREGKINSVETDYSENIVSAKEIMNPYHPLFARSVCSKIFSRSAIFTNEKNLTFQEDLVVGEDSLFWFGALLNSKTVFLSGRKMYHYLDNSNSVMNSMSYDKSYNDFISRKRTVDLMKNQDTELIVNNKNSCVYRAVNALSASDFVLDDRAYEMQKYIRYGLKDFCKCKFIKKRHKFYAVLISINLHLFMLAAKIRNSKK